MDNKYYFIVNPIAGKGKHLSFLPEISEFCNKNKIQFDIVITKYPRQAIELARQAIGKYQVIVAVGGDGTVNEVVNGLAQSQATLGVLPIGSGNDFAYQLGYSRNLKKDLKILLKNKTRKIDIGLVNEQHYFVNGFGVGFDGEVASRVRRFLKYSSGFFAYLMAVLRTLATYKFRQVRVSLDDNQIINKKILLIATCNGTTYGGGFNVAPSAKMDDGFFTICLIDKAGRFYALRNIQKIARGAHIKLPIVHMYTCKKINIESEHNLIAQYDGEVIPAGRTFEAKILPKQLIVISNE
ncbi:diacylglycerol kinase family lipid kinase [Patescibacteria group bacterium]|nr:diacylglycerol kinase family lipid kinase [Patescibacteria group bacterium]MBU0963732.1 diacylglycerol kinase family lipid kinase [Patescibacteria group bacterium]